jgi:S-adenosylmethionine:tRNA ribosyltransferase-isomerase
MTAPAGNPDNEVFDIESYDYKLPQDLIAQNPADRRQDSRLLVLGKKTGSIRHLRFYEIADLINPGDLLVVNNTKVLPARLFGRKQTGGKVEVLLIDYAGGRQTGAEPYCFECRCLIRASKAPGIGTKLFFDKGLEAIVTAVCNGTFDVKFLSPAPFEKILDQIGHVPLPPYIQRQPGLASQKDRTCYQTVYAEKSGAVAAPTAGLHFTEELLEKIMQKGADIARITLHVSYGTFMPVRVTDIRNHQMHSEHYEVPQAAAEKINAARREKRRIIAVGTTSVRTLEFASDDSGKITPHKAACDLFIYPGYRFKTIDAMITNFHLPKSTLLMLVSAFAGKQNILSAYRQAVEEKYRFFSYGDAMFIADL